MSEESWDSSEGGGPRGELIPIPAADPPKARRRTKSSALATRADSQPGVEAAAATQNYASHLSETSGSAYLYCSMGHFFREVGPDAYKAYLAKLLVDAGDPSDPIERMLVEQVALAHHNVGRLHVKAASAASLEEARIYLGSAVLLTGEFRRTVSTLKTYREPRVASTSKAEAAPATHAGLGADSSPSLGEEPPVAELGSNLPPGTTDHDPTIVPFAAQPEAGTGGTAELGEATGPERRRGRKAPRRGAG